MNNLKIKSASIRANGTKQGNSFVVSLPLTNNIIIDLIEREFPGMEVKDFYFECNIESKTNLSLNN